LSPQSGWLVTGVMALLLATACAGPKVLPARLDAKNDTCSACRMPVSDPRLAAELVAPGEEPLFFDDIGCLRDYLARRPAPRGATAYVADPRTGAFARAGRALYTHCPSIETPMASHLIAHADVASRDADAAAPAGTRLSPREVFGPAGPPGGTP